MYQLMASLPILKRSDVTTPPSIASSQRILASGNHLKSMAKSAERTASERRKLAACQNRVSPPPTQDEKALRTVLMTRDTASRNPSPKMPAKEIKYVRRYHQIPAPSGSLVSQMLLSASLS